jgi:hypothetical protein
MYIRLLQDGWNIYASDRLAWPFGYTQYEYPISNTLILLVQKLFATLWDNPFRVIAWTQEFIVFQNAAGAFYVLRRFGTSVIWSFIGALAFAFSQFVVGRATAGHLYVADGLTIPLATLLMAHIAGFLRLGRFEKFIVLLLMSVGNIYFVFFGLLSINVTGIGCSLSRRNVRPALEGVLLSAIAAAIFLLTMLPNLYHMAMAGVHTVVRSPIEQIAYGLRLFDTFWPSELTPRVNALYQAIDPNRTGLHEFVGFLSVCGIITCIFSLFIAAHGAPAEKSLSSDDLKDRQFRSYLGFMILFCVLFAVPYGLGLIFNTFVNPIFRAQDRFSIYLIFWGILGALSLTAARESLWRNKHSHIVVLSLLALAATIDLGRKFNFFNHNRSQSDVATDEAGAAAIDLVASLINAKTTHVFQLPIHPFPEAGPRGKRSDYFHLLPFIYDNSKKIHWSYGVTRAQDKALDFFRAVEKDLALGDTQQAYGRLACAGYDSIVIDKLAYRSAGDIPRVGSASDVILENAQYRALRVPVEPNYRGPAIENCRKDEGR